jgi:hypothetical protein
VMVAFTSKYIIIPVTEKYTVKYNWEDKRLCKTYWKIPCILFLKYNSSRLTLYNNLFIQYIFNIKHMKVERIYYGTRQFNRSMNCIRIMSILNTNEKKYWCM